MEIVLLPILSALIQMGLSYYIERLRRAKALKSLMIRTEKIRNLLIPYCLNHYD